MASALLEMLRISWFPLLLLLVFAGISHLSRVPVIWTTVLLIVFGIPLLAAFVYRKMRQRNLGTESGNRIFTNKIFSELNYGARQLRPFIFFGLCLALAPLTVLFMFAHWVYNTFGFNKKNEPKEQIPTLDSIVLRQNVAKADSSQLNFFSSSQFSPTIFAIVALGVPTAVALLLYHFLGIENMLSHAHAVELIPINTRDVFSAESLLQQSRHVLLSTKNLEQAAYAFNPNASYAHFATYAYLMSLAWCMVILFFRAYFTFPLHFASTEYDVELNSSGINKHSIKGWFAELVWYTWPAYLPTQIPWDKLERVEFVQGGVGRLSPLPSTLFEKETFIYKGLNRLAVFTDAVIDKMGRTEYLRLTSAGGGSTIKLNLWELSDEQKASLFYSIRKWAPWVQMDAKVQTKLLGSAVTQEARYTQIWFDLLINQKQGLKDASLSEGECLQEGKYKIISKVGRGGQAQVYLAETGTAPVERVVLKEFILSDSDSLAALLESAADFERESSVLGRLANPHIVKMHEIFAENRRAYLVLEYVEGISLREQVRTNGRLSEAELIPLALKMADILSYLHKQDISIVHCDFSPDNILLLADGSLKLIDFSIASTAASVGNGNCIGKHAYIPPEQFRSMPVPQSDLYAMGASMYFLLTGSDPRPISSSDPRKGAADVSEGLANLVMKATALDLNDRYSEIEWLKMDLLKLNTANSSEEEKSEVVAIPKEELERA